MQAKLKEMIDRAEEVIADLKDYIGKAKTPESTRFKILADGWVLDKILGIEWGPSSTKRMNWEDAKKCAAEQGGRLPTVKELRSLVEYDRYNPAIDTAFFGDTKTDDWYWTGTEVAGVPSCAWVVSFDDGSVGHDDEGYTFFVRPVRASQSLII